MGPVAGPSDGIARPQVPVHIIGGPAAWIIVDLKRLLLWHPQIDMLSQREIVETHFPRDPRQEFVEHVHIRCLC